MNLKGTTVLIMGGAGLVGVAVARLLTARGPARLVIGSLRRSEAEEAVAQLRSEPGAEAVSIEPTWGDLFHPEALKERSRADVLADASARRLFVDEVYDELTEDVFQRSALGKLLVEVAPDVIVDCVNTAGALAYQNVFGSVELLRQQAARGEADEAAVERHLATLYLPQLIRHTQIVLEGMKRAETKVYVKVGTAGTGGMGLNIPFTHSEERPSRMLLAKTGIAGAQTLYLYLMARTPGAPAVKEVKPTAAISWKSVGMGPIRRAGRVMTRHDAARAVSLQDAFAGGEGDGSAWVDTGQPLEGVYLDAGENGLFSLSEFEALTALGLMEYVTPEEIAENVLREILSHPTGKDVVTALDSATMGPTYRAGVLRSVALDRMEALEAEAGIRSGAYEMLGPPRLTKLLFEGEILRRLHGMLEEAAKLDAAETSRRADELIRDDADLRQRILSAGLPILLPDGERVLRGPVVHVRPERGLELHDQRLVERGWVDLRTANWTRWSERCAAVLHETRARPGVDLGSISDHEYGDLTGEIRPGRLGAWILRYEEKGERIKR